MLKQSSKFRNGAKFAPCETENEQNWKHVKLLRNVACPVVTKRFLSRIHVIG